MKIQFSDRIRSAALILAAICLTCGAMSAFTLSEDRAGVAATPTPTPTASPTLSPTATPTPAPVMTVAALQSSIRSRLFRPELRRGQVGIKVVSQNTGKVIYEDNSEKYFMPASNMKNFTVAAALERLTPDFKFVTGVYAAAPPDTAGNVSGDLRIAGRGDISISTRFTNGDYYKRLDDLADKIVQAGVKHVNGGLVGDETYFEGDPLNGTWEIEDISSPDGAEVSALPLNDNAIDIVVQPGPVGYACSVKVTPLNPIMRVVNQCLTSRSGTARTLNLIKRLDQNILEITGMVPAGDPGYSDSIAISHPADLFVALLKQRLELKGVTVGGGTRTVSQRTELAPAQNVEIARLESPPLSFIAAQTMKPSQNMYTETLLWTMGEESRRSIAVGTAAVPSGPSAQLGLAVVRNFLTSVGIPQDAVIQKDGSGLSRRDLVTPAAVVQLYLYMAKQSKYAQAWRDALAIGGIDGTLRRRFAGTRASGNLHGKTGTLDQVSALSGYVTTAAGEPVVFSMIVNGIPVTRDRTAPMDEIVLDLVNFNGKLDQ
jgi:D-alanyl-D-alanine carboxypeptidase/D-alanyl-D-alanine-endopeptidase (penicillin-binding protein 4)